MKKIFIVAGLLIGLFAQAQEIKWYTFEEAVELNKTTPKKMLIDVYTDWCGWCKVMDQKTFSNEIIAAYLNDEYYPVKLNAEQKDDIVFNGHTYKFVNQGRGYHELAAALLNNQMSYPAFVFLNEQIQIIHVQKGFVKPQPFDEMIKFIGGEHYAEGTSMEEWLKGYSSPIKE